MEANIPISMRELISLKGFRPKNNAKSLTTIGGLICMILSSPCGMAGAVATGADVGIAGGGALMGERRIVGVAIFGGPIGLMIGAGGGAEGCTIEELAVCGFICADGVGKALGCEGAE